jgi:hypothetical protein
VSILHLSFACLMSGLHLSFIMEADLNFKLLNTDNKVNAKLNVWLARNVKRKKESLT